LAEPFYRGEQLPVALFEPQVSGGLKPGEFLPLLSGQAGLAGLADQVETPLVRCPPVLVRSQVQKGFP
jgi:hypothetical protein